MNLVMELLSTETYFILVDGEQSLWINRKDGSYSCKTDITAVNSITSSCLGTVYGFIGKLHFSDSAEPRLVFIRQQALVGVLKGCNVYKIVSVVSVPLESEAEIMLEPCCKPHYDQTKENENAASAISGTSSDSNAAKLIVKVKTSAIHPGTVGPRKSEKLEKVERRILDEFHKMFTEADSFYYSTNYDITNTVQRHILVSEGLSEESQLPLWQRADSRFFWNHHMMSELINSKDTKLDRWIVPIIQGFIQFESCDVEHLYDAVGPEVMVRGHIELCLISRRSRYRAGTRYLRRGVDEDGKVANYVETEQIMVFKGHIISFVQTRGSIPVFWSQPGFRYRPPPRLERNEEENYNAFRKHFEEESSIYGPVVIVNLVEKTGKEKVVGDAYLENILRQDSPNLIYVAFDFHECCRGMRFENVSVLVDKLESVIKNMNYCWVDSYGIVLKQSGVCRVNCIDCLDRTNVVQTHWAKHILCAQLSKLGLVAPEIGLPENVKLKLQTLWANNGDTISKQYAGTNALKGDYTRTGERKITGVMKDGMNSANRYYLNRFKDASRQAVIELMLGIRKTVTEADLDTEKPADEKENTTEQIKMVIDDVKKCIIPKYDIILGSWGLVNAKLNEPDTIDIDSIFILTEKQYYVTEYDCTMDAITETQKVNLLALESLELGFEHLTQPSNFLGFFHHGQNSSQSSSVPSLRLNYRHDGEINFHQFRSSNIRFFNNVPVAIQHPEEMLEALKMISEAIKIAVEAQGKIIQLIQSPVLPNREPSKTGIPGMATSWVHRYFNHGQADHNSDPEPPSRKFTAASFERFTPKYFRRSSTAVGESSKALPTADSPKSAIVSVANMDAKLKGQVTWDASPKEEFKGDGETTEIPSNSQLQKHSMVGFRNITPFNYVVDTNARTPIECHSNILAHVQDLVLPSCGILSLHDLRATSSLLMSPSPEFIFGGEECRNDTIGASPVTPVSDSISQESTNIQQSSIPNQIHSNNILQRHRHSLPANSLGIGVGLASPLRAVTPEITITEEPLVDLNTIGVDINLVGKNISGLGGISMVPKRISRSSEDVTIMSKSSAAISLVNPCGGLGGLGLRLRNLAPIVKNENRCTSDQDIFGSLVNMKGSHSESALRDNPFQTQGPQKNVVLAPLGKLARGMQNLGANYLDPRKIRDSFKQPRNDPSKKEVIREPFLLEERKRNCKTLIIDV